MNMHISNSGRVGEIANVGNSNRLQALSGSANVLSASPPVNFGAIQQSLNAIMASVNSAPGAPISPSNPTATPMAPPASTSATGGKTAAPGSLTIKSIYGEAPAGLNRSGLSGIIDKSGHNLSNREIADFFDSNPTTQDIASMGFSLGLNSYQQARALAVWRGETYQTPIWAPAAASTVGGSPGGETIGDGAPAGAWGAWGNNPASLIANNYQETVALASSSSPARNPTA